MKITDVQAILISIPLKKPTSTSSRTMTAREYVVTRVRTDEGITGEGYVISFNSRRIGVLQEMIRNLDTHHKRRISKSDENLHA